MIPSRRFIHGVLMARSAELKKLAERSSADELAADKLKRHGLPETSGTARPSHDVTDR